MRVKASETKTAKLYDFKCKDCGVTFEAMATWAELQRNKIKHGSCRLHAERLFSAPRVDSHAAASWRR
jgi:putative FmdB family regulatory protein